MSKPKVFGMGGVGVGVANQNDDALMADMLADIRDELSRHDGSSAAELMGRFPELADKIRELADEIGAQQ
jgi:hypothetical protein